MSSVLVGLRLVCGARVREPISLGVNMATFLIALAVGIATGVAANALYQWLTQARSWLTDRVNISGVWGERMIGGGDRRFSVGTIRYDLRRRMWVFDGTNYYNDGRPFCHWRTITAYLDQQSKRYYYVFLNTHDDEVHTGYTGFGFVDLEKKGRTWVPRRGAFAAGNPGECFRSHSMVKLNALPVSQDQLREMFVSELAVDK